MKISFDLDSTLLDFMTFMTRFARSYGLSVQDPNAYYFRDIFGLTKTQAAAIEPKAVEAYLCGAPLYPYAKETLEALAADGHEIVFATARNAERDADATDLILRRHGLPYPVVFCKDHDKVGDIKELRADYHVEDKPSVIMACADAGIHVVRFVQPYNGMLKHENIVASVPSWRYAIENLNAIFKAA